MNDASAILFLLATSRMLENTKIDLKYANPRDIKIEDIDGLILSNQIVFKAYNR